MSAPKLHRSRDGRTLCATHASSGAPNYHTEGCQACAEARAKGIIRPDVTSIPKRQRGRMVRKERRIDWSKIKPENRAAMADAVDGFRRRG